MLTFYLSPSCCNVIVRRWHCENSLLKSSVFSPVKNSTATLSDKNKLLKRQMHRGFAPQQLPAAVYGLLRQPAVSVGH